MMVFTIITITFSNNRSQPLVIHDFQDIVFTRQPPHHFNDSTVHSFRLHSLSLTNLKYRLEGKFKPNHTIIGAKRGGFESLRQVCVFQVHTFMYPLNKSIRLVLTHGIDLTIPYLFRNV